MSSQEPLSPPGSPLKAHESIWKRSKKILGMSRFTFLQQIDAQSPRGMSMSLYYYFVPLLILPPGSPPLLPFPSALRTHCHWVVQAGVIFFEMVLPEDTVTLSPVQALSFLTLRTKLISWLDKNSPEGSDAANSKPPVSKRREQVRRAQK
jgi:hypothetical protein